MQLKLQSLSDIGMSKALSSTVTMNIVFFCCFCPMAQVEKVDLFDSLSQSLSFVVVLNHGCCWLHF